MSDMDDDDTSMDRNRDRNRRERPNRFSDGGRDRSNDRGREPRSMKASQNRVYVSNIPYEFRWQDIKDLFRNQVGDVQFVELFVDDNDKPKGSGIVEFADHASVEKCMEVMQRFEVKNRKLVIKDDSGVVRNRNGAIVGGNSKRMRDGGDRYRDDHRRDSLGGGNMSMRKDDGNWGNTYGLSAQFLQSLNIDPPLNTKVFVANLQYNIDKEKLFDVFKLAGRVISVEMPLDKEGKSRGFAVIEFDHPVEAVQAISMFHNQVLYDRHLAVRMDRVNDSFKMPEGLKTIGMGLGPNGKPLKNIAHNLPSVNSVAQIGGSGILGAVPNNPLQLASALSGLNSQVLQAANLSGLANNLLGNGLGGNDLSSLVQNPLSHKNSASQQLAGLGVQNSIPSLTGGNAMGVFDSGDGNINRGFQSNNRIQPFGGDGGGGDGGGYGNNRMSFTSNNAMRDGSGQDGGKSFSKKLLVSNLPATASVKMLYTKFTEFGDIVSFEEKAHGSLLITYGSDWQAETARKNLDKARIDGRLIDARLYF